MNTVEEKELDYLWVADANGLTSISEVQARNEFGMVERYCHANSHRHCMWGILSTDANSADILQQHIHLGLGIQAAKLLLDMKISFPENLADRNMKKLTAISKNKLQDPFGSKVAY